MRNLLPVLFATLTFCCFAGTPTSAQVEIHDISPRLESVLDIAASPRNPLYSIAYVGEGRVLRSADVGASYLETSLPALSNVVELAWDAGGVAYVMTPDTLFVSMDGALTWSARAFPGANVTGFAASQLRPLDIWATDSIGSAWHSTNGGVSWQIAAPTGLGFARGIALSMNSADDVVIFGGRDVLTSSDAGASWTAATPALGSGEYIKQALVVGTRLMRLRVSPFTFHMTTYDEFVEVSDDLGATWIGSTGNIGGLAPIGLLEVDTRSGSVDVYFLRDDRIQKSSDAGLSWELARPSGTMPAVPALAFPSGSSDLILYSGVGVTRAEGFDDPLQYASGDFASSQTFFAAQNPVNPDHLVAQVEVGNLQSLDGGASWSQLTGEPFSSLRFGATGRLFGLSAGRIYERIDDAWERLGGLTAPTSVRDYDIGERDPNLVVAVAGHLTGMARELSYSLDGGAIWTDVLICVPSGAQADCNPTLLQVEIIERAGLPVRIAVAWNSYGAEIATTDDFGATWTSRAEGVPSAGLFGPRITMAQSRRSPGEIIVGFGTLREMLVTYDGLETLLPIGSPVIAETLAIGGGAEDLMVRAVASASGFDVEQSRDGGTTWDFVVEVEGSDEPTLQASVSGASYIVGGSVGLLEVIVSPAVSTTVCDPPVLNSAGYRARLVASGSDVIANQELRLDLDLLPADVAVLFLASQTTGLIPNPGGSLGNLCLTGSIGRFSTIRFSGIAGATSIEVDPLGIAQPNGPVPAMAGSSWAFQAWYRDTEGGTATSNLSSAVGLTWQ